MTERTAMQHDNDLELRLADLGRAVAWPAPSASLTASIGDRLRTGAGARAGGGWWAGLRGRPIRRSLLVAVGALLLVAAAVAAAGIVLPGLRIVFLPPGATVPPASVVGSLGSPLGLGTATDLDGAAAVGGFEPLLPGELGPPDEVFTLNRRVTLLWKAGPDLPATIGGVGLLVTELRGSVASGWYEKQVDSGATNVEPVRVGDTTGYWLDGAPHQLVYQDPSGAFVEETRRVVGDVLIWRRGDLTLRIESAMGRDATIALAESMAPRR